MFKISETFGHSKAFQPSLVLANKAEAYMSEPPFKCSSLG